MTEFTAKEQEVFTFLDDLRESGVTNMFGARPYVQKEFPGLGQQGSAEYLGKWMSTFEERHPND